MTCAPLPPPRPAPAPVSVPTSRPFSVTIRLKTSPTERTPSPGFQSYFPAITRARPANLSDSVPASLDRAACVVCARSGARLSTAAIATAHAIGLVRVVFMNTSSCRLHSSCCVVSAAAHAGFMKSPAPILAAPPLYDGERTIPQLHNCHHDIDCQARSCYSWGGGVFLFD